MWYLEESYKERLKGQVVNGMENKSLVGWKEGSEP